MGQRRRLKFTDFGSAHRDARELAHAGYDQVGNWDLAQILDHLAGAMNGSIDGFPTNAPWLVRRFMGPRWWKKIRAAGRLKAGVWIPEKARPVPGGDASKNLDRFAAAIDRFEQHKGKVMDHPMLGRLGLDGWRQFHLMHASHHLGFLLPKAAAPVAQTQRESS